MSASWLATASRSAGHVGGSEERTAHDAAGQARARGQRVGLGAGDETGREPFDHEALEAAVTIRNPARELAQAAVLPDLGVEGAADAVEEGGAGLGIAAHESGGGQVAHAQAPEQRLGRVARAALLAAEQREAERVSASPWLATGNGATVAGTWWIRRSDASGPSEATAKAPPAHSSIAAMAAVRWRG